MIARLAPAATALRIAGGVLTIIGTYLPWATFVLNDGAYPDKSTLNFFVDPLGVTGYRLHLLLLGLAVIVLTVLKVQPTGRMVRGLGWGIAVVAVINGAYITVKGGGLGAITAADDGAVAFGAIVTLLGGIAAIVGGTAGGLGERPTLSWRLPWWVEWILLLVVFVIVLLLVAAVLTSGGQGGVVNAYAGAVFLSLLGALGGAFAALSASGLLGWVSTVSERHRTFSVIVLLAMALGLPLTAAGTEYWMTVAANIGVYAATAIGLNIVVGLAGLLDLGYVAFLGIGAFTAANLSGAAASKVGIQLPFPIVMVICAVVAGCFGAIVGSPTLRVRGDYLAIVTLAFGEIFTRVAQNNIGGLTGGANAIPNIPQVSLFGTAFNESIIIGVVRLPSGVLYYLLIVLLVAFVMLVFAHLKDSRLGRAWIAIREDEDAATRDGHPHRPDQDPRVPHRRDAGRARRRVLRPQDRGCGLRQLPVHRVGHPARGRHPRRHGHDPRRGARRVDPVRPAGEAARVRRLPAPAVRARAHRAHAAAPAGAHRRQAPEGRAGRRARTRARRGGARGSRGTT